MDAAVTSGSDDIRRGDIGHAEARVGA